MPISGPSGKSLPSEKRRQRRGRPKAQEKTRKREYLLRVARDHFIERGYGGCSIDGIAAASGISKMTIYRWYDGKMELFREVMLHLVSEIMEEWSDSTRDDRPLEETLEELAWTLCRSLMQPAATEMTRLMIAEAPHIHGVAREILTLLERRGLTIIETCIAEMGRRGLLRVEDPYRTAYQFATLAIGSYRFLLVGRNSEAEERERVKDAVKLFLDGCRASST